MADHGVDDQASLVRELTARELFFNKVLANKFIWLLAIANFFAYIARYALHDWGPTYLKEVKGASIGEGGWAIFVMNFGGIPGGGTGTGPSFFGVYNDSEPISSIRFTAVSSGGKSGSSTTFNSLDEVRYTEPDFLKLRITAATGLVEIVNETDTPFDIDSYRITSSTNDSLNFSQWNSLSDQNIDAVDGGDDFDETWDEAGGSDDGVLAESFLLGSSLFGENRVESLGNAFKIGGNTSSLSFQFRRATDGVVTNGIIEIIANGLGGDYNTDGIVNAADYTLWRDQLGANVALLNENPAATTPGVVDQEDYDYWKSQFGATLGSGSLAGAAVPEPTSAGLLAMMLAATLLTICRRRVS